MLAAFRGHIPAEQLLQYRGAGSGLPGHPELHLPSAEFASGRLGRKFSKHHATMLAVLTDNVLQIWYNALCFQFELLLTDIPVAIRQWSRHVRKENSLLPWV